MENPIFSSVYKNYPASVKTLDSPLKSSLKLLLTDNAANIVVAGRLAGFETHTVLRIIKLK